MCRSNFPRIALLTLSSLELIFGITIWVFNIIRLYYMKPITTLALSDSDQVVLTFLFPLTGLLGILAASKRLNSSSSISSVSCGYIVLILHVFFALACIGWSIRAFDIVYVVVRPRTATISETLGNVKWSEYSVGAELAKLNAVGNAQRWTAFTLVLALIIFGDILYLLSAFFAALQTWVVARNVRRTTRLLEQTKSKQIYRSSANALQMMMLQQRSAQHDGIYNQGFGSQDLTKLEKTSPATFVTSLPTPVPPAARMVVVAPTNTTVKSHNVTKRVTQVTPVNNNSNNKSVVQVKTLAQSTSSNNIAHHQQRREQQQEHQQQQQRAAKGNNSNVYTISLPQQQQQQQQELKNKTAMKIQVSASVGESSGHSTGSSSNSTSSNLSTHSGTAVNNNSTTRAAVVAIPASNKVMPMPATAMVNTRVGGGGGDNSSGDTSTFTLPSDTAVAITAPTKPKNRAAQHKSGNSGGDGSNRLRKQQHHVQYNLLPADAAGRHQQIPQLIVTDAVMGVLPASSQYQQRRAVRSMMIVPEQQSSITPADRTHDHGYLSDDEQLTTKTAGFRRRQHQNNEQLQEDWQRPQVTAALSPRTIAAANRILDAKKQFPTSTIAVVPTTSNNNNAYISTGTVNDYYRHRHSVPENVLVQRQRAERIPSDWYNTTDVSLRPPDEEEYFSSVAGFEGYREHALQQWQAARQQQNLLKAAQSQNVATANYATVQHKPQRQPQQQRSAAPSAMQQRQQQQQPQYSNPSATVYVGDGYFPNLNHEVEAIV